jgi:hypothetical protein
LALRRPQQLHQTVVIIEKSAELSMNWGRSHRIVEPWTFVAKWNFQEKLISLFTKKEY